MLEIFPQTFFHGTTMYLQTIVACEVAPANSNAGQLDVISSYVSSCSSRYKFKRFHLNSYTIIMIVVYKVSASSVRRNTVCGVQPFEPSSMHIYPKMIRSFGYHHAKPPFQIEIKGDGCACRTASSGGACRLAVGFPCAVVRWPLPPHIGPERAQCITPNARDLEITSRCWD